MQKLVFEVDLFHASLKGVYCVVLRFRLKTQSSRTHLVDGQMD